MSDLRPAANSSTMAAHDVFKVLASTSGDGCLSASARLGRLALPGRKVIDTPNYTAVTSRGVIPHLTPEVVSRHTSFGSAYMALEDFVERKDPPIFKTPPGNGNPRLLHKFTAFPQDVVTVLAPRRSPAVTPPSGNTHQSMAIFTSTGFDSITIPKYAAAVEALQPDVVIPPADLLHTSSNPAPKRQQRMADRTEEWVDNFLDRLAPSARTGSPSISVLAPVIPAEHHIQWSYLSHLSEDLAEDLTGLAIYDVNLLPELTGYEALGSLPRLSLDSPSTPHDILRQVSLGVDMVMAPFVNNISDAGVALTFSFPPPEISGIQPLGIDMWSAGHKTSVTPLAEGCGCYACQKHHRAFINHLLNAKEMLGWTLLQIHNHHVMGEFFAAIRAGLEKGLSEFEQLSQKFAAAYEVELPAGTGQRPRARGYHFKSEASQEKYNKPVWRDFDASQVQTPLEPDTNGQALADKGFAEKQSQ